MAVAAAAASTVAEVSMATAASTATGREDGGPAVGREDHTIAAAAESKVTGGGGAGVAGSVMAVKGRGKKVSGEAVRLHQHFAIGGEGINLTEVDVATLPCKYSRYRIARAPLTLQSERDRHCCKGIRSLHEKGRHLWEWEWETVIG